MMLLVYLTVGIVILWLAAVLASFVKNKTGNAALSAVAWFVSAYLLFELSLILLNRLGK